MSDRVDTPSILDVAAFILAELGDLSTMKLQKLCYFAQGWSLAWTERPLFADDFEAGLSGPVSRTLYAKHEGEYSVSVIDCGDAQAVDHEARLIIRAVLAKYSFMSGPQLSELSKRGGPWIAAKAAHEDNTPVTQTAILDHFAGLLPNSPVTPPSRAKRAGINIGDIVYGFAGGDRYADWTAVASGLHEGEKWMVLAEVDRPGSMFLATGETLASLPRYTVPQSHVY